jgi:hypothetical protein
MKRYKARVIIRGAMDQQLYGTKPDSLRRRAIKLLTEHEPGWGSLQPEQVVISEQTGYISGNEAQWIPVETIYYHDLPESQLEWKRKSQSSAS